MTVPTKTYAQALAAARDLGCEGVPDSEYTRGVVELIADLFPVEGDYLTERIERVKADLTEAS